ncbi:MAG: hypothetical protein U0Z53_20850 [Blastocatellia bacterium]
MKTLSSTFLPVKTIASISESHMLRICLSLTLVLLAIFGLHLSINAQTPNDIDGYTPSEATSWRITISESDYNNGISFQASAQWMTVNLLKFNSTPGGYNAQFNIAANPDGAVRTGSFSYQIVGEPRRSVSVLQAGKASVTTPGSYTEGTAAPDSIAVIFGASLSASTADSNSTPLPTTLNNTVAKIFKASGQFVADAELFFVSPGQINFHIPPNQTDGNYYVKVNNTGANSNVAMSKFTIAQIFPDVFWASYAADPPPAMLILRVGQNGTQTYETPLLDAQGNQLPIEVNRPGETVYFIIYGTGMRNGINLSQCSAELRTGTTVTNLPLQYVGPQGGYVGEDQVNLQIPPSLAGRGKTSLRLLINGTDFSNATFLNFQ